ncbi:Tigger transposable element-derived protein 7 [Chionoecetes opilio]|uniref:Tigger transposable element-derived protein 7 n=1 Tax=Chionoecetes opilio TaxID=41210 RepID=A0A8J5D273_CHIOP|nr:Tigger transposable element-derived protein 7 [Chionoecetes opilio]
MCFDTTSANTGAINGACTILQQKIGRPLVSLACRHHVHELVLEKAFSTCLGSSSGPEITIFSRFKDYWSYINQSAINPPTNEDLPETLVLQEGRSHSRNVSPPAVLIVRNRGSTSFDGSNRRFPSYAPANDLGFAKDILQYHDETLDIKPDFLSANLGSGGKRNRTSGLPPNRGLRVVNDTAERGVALIQSFNLRLTKDEEQRQFLLQVVEAHRHQTARDLKGFPSPAKPATMREAVAEWLASWSAELNVPSLNPAGGNSFKSLVGEQKLTLDNLRKYDLKSGIFNLSRSWKDVSASTLSNGWNRLIRGTDPVIEFEGFETANFHRHIVQAGETATEEDVSDWLDGDEVYSLKLIALNVTPFDLPTLLGAAGVTPHGKHAVIRLTCAFLRRTQVNYHARDSIIGHHQGIVFPKGFSQP